MLQGFNSLNYSYSPLDGSGVVRVLKNSSCSYWWSCLVCVCVCVCVCVLVPACSHLCYSLTLTARRTSAPSLCPAKCHFLGTKMKTRCSLILKSFKVLWDTDPKVQSMSQVLSFNYDKIQLIIFKWTVWCSVHSHCCATKLENFFSTS